MTRVFAARASRGAGRRFQGTEGGRLSRNLVLATALAGGLLVSAAPMTQAQVTGATGGEGSGDGGAGGNAGQPGAPGIGGTSPTSGGAAGTPTGVYGEGGDGEDSTTGGGGGGGGGGASNIVATDDISSLLNGGDGGNGGNGPTGAGGGGAGGDGAVSSASSLSVSADVTGGDGGDGGTLGGNAGGGGGGAGIVLTNNDTVEISANVTGGRGGNGALTGFGGGGGAGIIMVNGGSLDNSGAIRGGTGGSDASGGAGVLLVSFGDVHNTGSGSITGGAGLQTGDGGAAIELRDGGVVVNSGSIIGGSSDGWDDDPFNGPAGGTGSGGASGWVPNIVQEGTPGVGIIGANIGVANAGTIKGGVNKDNGEYANAITFTGGTNWLELLASSNIVGVVDATGGTNDTLLLHGKTDSFFDISAVGPAAQYRGFEAFKKVNVSTWTLTGTTTTLTPWSINGGTLSISSDGALGAASGGLTFDGGTLRNTAAFATARDITLNAGGGTFQTDANLTVNGDITGSGALTKTGAGTLTLTGNGTVGIFSLHEGTVVVDGGTLDQPALGAQNFIGQYSGDNATLFITGGGTVSAGSNKVHVGDMTNSRGTVVVTGDGSSLEVRDLTVGFAGEGNLFVVNGGDFVTNAFLNVGGGNYFELGTGRLDVSGTGSSATINGSLTIAGFGDGSTGVVTVSKGGVLDVAAVRMSNDNPSGSAELNIGAASTDPNDAVAPGTLHTSGHFSGTEVQFSHDNARLNFNHTGNGYVFDTPLESTNAGAGFVHHYAGDTILTGNSSGFTGDTIIHGGTLSVNGILGGVVEVASGGALGGSGTVGATTIGTGGTIAPGNSIGILTVNGNYTQKAGSIYEAEIDPAGNADLIDVTGTATIEGGTVFALKAPGAYSVGTRYTLLTAAGGVTGVYDTLDQNAPFVALELAYDPGNVYLDVIRNAVSFCAMAATGNQCATATGAESTGPGNPVHDVIAGLPNDATARDAFDQLSGEIHASGKGAMLEDSRFAREAALARARAGAHAAPAAPVMAYWPSDLALATASSESLSGWGHAYGAWSQVDGDGNAAGLDHFSGGLLTGIDAMAGDWRLGAFAGFGHSSFSADERASSGSSNNYHIGLYGGTQWGDLGLRAGAAYSWHDIETTREVSVAGLADTLTADYGAGTAQVFGELGYTIERGGFAFEPFAGLAYVNLNTEGFTEQGGAAALTSGGSNTGVTFATLGVRASSAFTLGTVNATAHGMLGWRHAFGDTTPAASNAFAGGDAFSIAGLPIAENAAVIEAGLDLDLTETATLGLSYSGQIADDAQEHGLEAAFTVAF